MFRQFFCGFVPLTSLVLRLQLIAVSVVSAAAARAVGHSLISDRLKQDERKQGVIQQLSDTARLTTQLEAQLRWYV